MKSLAHKLLALTFVIALTTGCASSVTDAGLASQPDNTAKTAIQKPKPQNPSFGTDSDMQPIYDKPAL